MYGDFSWTTDIMPVVQQFFNNGIIKGGLIAMVAIAVTVYGGRGLISIFFKRD